MSPSEPNRTQNDPRPTPPTAPDPADCCGEGCAHCVLDIYDTTLEQYEVALEAWRKRHPGELDRP